MDTSRCWSNVIPGVEEAERAESKQSFCHQQIELKVSRDLPVLNWSADHLVKDMRPNDAALTLSRSIHRVTYHIFQVHNVQSDIIQYNLSPVNPIVMKLVFSSL